MHETLKELAGDLQVIHESLERAEVIERQLGVYWREFEAERDQLRAENAALCKVNQSHADYYDIREDRDQLRDTVAGLRRALEGLTSRLDFVHADRQYQDVWYLNHLHNGEYKGATYTQAFAEAVNAIAASSDEHERRLKAEALREAAKIIDQSRANTPYAFRGYSAADAERALLIEADRLEAANG